VVPSFYASDRMPKSGVASQYAHILKLSVCTELNKRYIKTAQECRLELWNDYIISTRDPIMPTQSLVIESAGVTAAARSTEIPAILHVLPAGDDGTMCAVTDISGARMAIETHVRLRQGALVEIGWGSYLGFGEIVEVVQRHRNFCCTIQLEHVFDPESLGKFWKETE
jgi:hypothetical protein